MDGQYILDIDIVVSKHAEELAGDARQAAQVLAHQRHNRHITDDIHRAKLAQIVIRALQSLVLDRQFLISAHGHHTVLRVQRHGDVHLRRGDEVHRQVVPIEDGEDLGEEAVRAGAAVAVHVEHDDGVLDCDGGGAAALVQLGEVGAGAAAGELGLDGGFGDGLGHDDCAWRFGVQHVLDANGAGIVSFRHHTVL